MTANIPDHVYIIFYLTINNTHFVQVNATHLSFQLIKKNVKYGSLHVQWQTVPLERHKAQYRVFLFSCFISVSQFNDST